MSEHSVRHAPWQADNAKSGARLAILADNRATKSLVFASELRVDAWDDMHA